jgi:hypothetical protein
MVGSLRLAYPTLAAPFSTTHPGQFKFGFLVMAMVPAAQILGPDIHPENLFLAVGRAITEWEILEYRLATLYTIFRNSPGNVDMMMQYGIDGNSFLTRMSILRQAMSAHSMRSPSQASEAEFDSIVAETTLLSRERHKIVHGIVASHQRLTDQDLNGWMPTYYSVVPAWQNRSSLTKHDTGPRDFVSQGYDYRTADIDAIAVKLRAMSKRVEDYALTFAPKPNAINI